MNVGSQGGLGAILRILIHCVAHRLELAVLNAYNKVEYIGNFHDTLKL